VVRPQLYIHVGRAIHFVRWELPEFAKFFDLVDAPSDSVPLLSFGPDVFEEAATLPASHRFALLFPGFSFNPVRDVDLRSRQRALMTDYFDTVFVNPGPLEIAYRGQANLELVPFSIDVAKTPVKRFRTSLNSLLHVSQDNPQKDWRRSESIMHKSGLSYEVFPPRDQAYLIAQARKIDRSNRLRATVGLSITTRLPVGYVSHEATIAKYQEYDGFVHVARDVRHPEFVDGMYTAAFMEAGATGALLFWHDTWGVGTPFETVFQLPLDTDKAAELIRDVRKSVDIERHSRRTREEMLDHFSPAKSVSRRAKKILESIG
jgi:hypothetical protein